MRACVGFGFVAWHDCQSLSCCSLNASLLLFQCVRGVLDCNNEQLNARAEIPTTFYKSSLEVCARNFARTVAQGSPDAHQAPRRLIHNEYCGAVAVCLLFVFCSPHTQAMSNSKMKTEVLSKLQPHFPLSLQRLRRKFSSIERVGWSCNHGTVAWIACGLCVDGV